MALPVIQRVREELPGTQLVYTYFSPSAERFASTVRADFSAYLPFDTARAADRVLRALRPTALVFSKVDVWPILAERAHRAGVKLGLISAAMPASSGRRSGTSSRFTRHAYAVLDAVGAASPDDATRLIEAGVRPPYIRVTGDTRYDQAWARAHVKKSHQELVSALRDDTRPTLVAGSTWPSDEAELFPAWDRLLATIPTARLILAPHEVHEGHLAFAEAWGKRTGRTIARLWDRSGTVNPEAATADIVLVNGVGVLADLYALAMVAYVGGGFHDAGLHSVVEPAVFGAPILIGPNNVAWRDAQLMLTAGGASQVRSADTLAAELIRLFQSPAERQAMGAALAAVVAGELGAAERAFELVRELLGTVQEKPLHQMHA